MTEKFEGFPREGFQFLSELADNNDKAWFEANRERYENDLLKPALAFVAVVGEGLKQVAPGVQYDLRTNGQGSLMRIYRDVRFSKDKSPYKTRLAGMLWEEEGKKTLSPAFGFEVKADGIGMMAGMFQFDKDQLTKYRQAVVDEVSGKKLEAALKEVAAAGDYGVAGGHYKNVPRGYDPDHRRADLLKHNALYVYAPQVEVEELVTPRAAEVCLRHFKNMAPVQQWLVEVLL